MSATSVQKTHSLYTAHPLKPEQPHEVSTDSYFYFKKHLRCTPGAELTSRHCAGGKVLTGKHCRPSVPTENLTTRFIQKKLDLYRKSWREPTRTPHAEQRGPDLLQRKHTFAGANGASAFAALTTKKHIIL